jgi:N-formylglutamate amidohydrolase
MNSVLTALYGAVIDCKDMVHSKVHLFSNKIADISLAQLRSGVCITTGGTDIECVAKHIDTHKVRRALFITDGWVGKPLGRHHDVLHQTKLAVAYMGESTNTADLATVANFTTVLS